MVVDNSNSTLGYTLLGLIGQAPLSGYDLRKLFSTTPLISYSDSPGAIYPALRRLEARGFVRGHVEEASGRRQRRTYQVTPKGRSAFKRWQTQPIRQPDVIRNLETLMMRFAFMDQFAGKAAALRFLKEFQKELAAYLPTLRQYFKSNRKQMPLSGRLALASGIQGYETLLRWTRTSIATYERAIGGKK